MEIDRVYGFKNQMKVLLKLDRVQNFFSNNSRKEKKVFETVRFRQKSLTTLLLFYYSKISDTS